MSIELPKTVRIGYRTYTVEKWAQREAFANNRMGEHDSLEKIIRVDTEHNDEETLNILLHEIFHGCYQMGELPHEDEEKIVSLMANVFTQVLQDSPDLIDFLQRATAKK